MDKTARQLRARSGALALHAKYGRDVVSAWGRNGTVRRYEQEVDPDHVLSDAERRQRAADLERSRMTILAQKSRAARAAKKMATDRLVHDQSLVTPVTSQKRQKSGR